MSFVIIDIPLEHIVIDICVPLLLHEALDAVTQNRLARPALLGWKGLLAVPRWVTAHW